MGFRNKLRWENGICPPRIQNPPRWLSISFKTRSPEKIDAPQATASYRLVLQRYLGK